MVEEGIIKFSDLDEDIITALVFKESKIREIIKRNINSCVFGHNDDNLFKRIVDKIIKEMIVKGKLLMVVKDFKNKRG